MWVKTPSNNVPLLEAPVVTSQGSQLIKQCNSFAEKYLDDIVYTDEDSSLQQTNAIDFLILYQLIDKYIVSKDGPDLLKYLQESYPSITESDIDPLLFKYNQHCSQKELEQYI